MLFHTFFYSIFSCIHVLIKQLKVKPTSFSQFHEQTQTQLQSQLCMLRLIDLLIYL